MMPHLAGNQAWALQPIAPLANVILDTAGSDPEAGVIEAVYRLVGVRRIVFGSDGPGRSFASQVAGITGSRIPNHGKKAILRTNCRRILEKHLR